MACVLVLDNM